jgi:hypothetical protein
MTPSGIDPATFRFVGQCLNHCATACPRSILVHSEGWKKTLGFIELVPEAEQESFQK